jgi:hypothetical protein
MPRKLYLALCLLAAPAALSQTPAIQAVLNAADYSPLIAPGVWVTLSGTQIPRRYVSPGRLTLGKRRVKVTSR